VDRRSFGGTFLHPDPIIGPGVQQFERQHTAAQHLVVKATDVVKRRKSVIAVISPKSRKNSCFR
jgi:hypothetical protein